MLHAVYFNKSNLGEWKISYRNKYVNSDTFQLEREKNDVAFVPSADGQPYATLAAFVLNIVRPCLVPHQKICHPSHRIFGHIHGTLNVDKKIN